jgi:phospholipase/carboxylesterase
MPSLRHRTLRTGELTTHVLDATDTPRSLVVFCHGFGAPGTDLVPLAQELVDLAPSLVETTRFAFPEAPLDLGAMGFFGGRAWFPIDIEALDAAQRAGRPDLLAASEPPGMKSARQALHRAVEALLRDARLAWSDLALGGFSQGAMMALDLALRSDEAVSQVFCYSPTLVDRPNWERRAQLRKGLPVLISHGEGDPLLPIAGTRALVDMLEAGGSIVDFATFRGGHTIPALALERTARALASR